MTKNDYCCGACRFHLYGRCWHPFALNPNHPIAGGREMAEMSWACNLFTGKEENHD